MTIYLQLFIIGVLFGGVYSLVSVGLSLIMGVLDIVNFAHGEYLMLAMYGVYWLNQIAHIHPYLAMLVMVPLMFLLGTLTEKYFIRFSLDKPMYIAIFVTFGISTILQNTALALWSADYRTIDAAFSNTTIGFGDMIIGLPKLIIFLVSLFVTFLIHLFLHYTRLGSAIRATAQKRDIAQLMGINVNFVYTITFGIGIACLGVAASLLMPIYPVYPRVGFLFVLTAFVAVVMGGCGSIKGAFIASIILGITESYSSYFFGPSWKQAIYFALFIGILIFKPQGLFAEEA